MNSAILIPVRRRSRRLPDKPFKHVLGKPILSYLVERMKFVNPDVPLYIITTRQQEDKKFDKLAESLSVRCFHGDNKNIIRRIWECACAYEIDFIVEVDGDDILCAPESAKKIIDTYTEQGHEVIETKGMPFGMNLVGFTRGVIDVCLEKCGPGKMETGWKELIIAGDFNHHTIEAPEELRNDQIRATLDYENDFKFFAKIITDLFPGCDFVPTQRIIEHLGKNPDVVGICSHLSDQYWANYHVQHDVRTKYDDFGSESEPDSKKRKNI